MAHPGSSCTDHVDNIEYRMQPLYDSRGVHIANAVNDQLHAPSGANIGHFLRHEAIFVDLRGRYVGEIVMGNRLMRNRRSRFTSVNFGSRGNRGNAGSVGTRSSVARVWQVAGYEDIPIEALL